jgi:cytoskeletal protein RodZ
MFLNCDVDPQWGQTLAHSTFSQPIPAEQHFIYYDRYVYYCTLSLNFWLLMLISAVVLEVIIWLMSSIVINPANQAKPSTSLSTSYQL